MICPNPECPDLLANGFPGEYVDGILTCPVCGAELIPEDSPASPVASATLTDGDVEVVQVFDSPHPAELTVVRALLDGTGIPYLLTSSGDYTFPGVAGSIRAAGGLTISVRTEDVEAATALLSAKSPELEGEPTW